jgi:hypothetical protein
MHKVRRSIDGIYDECWFARDDHAGLVGLFADKFECRILAYETVKNKLLNGFVSLRDNIGGCEILAIRSL